MFRLTPILACPLILMLFALSALGHETAATSADIALTENLGQVIPKDIMLRDDSGKPVNLSAFIDRPTIIAPVYFHCTHTCPLLLNGLASALGKIDMVQPGKDFRVVALSFDERETPALAREKKPNYMAAIGRPFPADAWAFLTGDKQNIHRFTDAAGLRFQRDGEDFSHPVALIVLAPGGKIVRYLYGTDFLPFDVTMAVTEAAKGKIGSKTNRVLAYCFSYDPLKKSYVFNILKVAGTVITMILISLLAYLVVSTKKHRGTTW